MHKFLKPVEPLQLWLLRRYWRVSRGLTMGAQGVVINEHNQVLLVRHGYRPGWHFPGGGVEKNETVHEALARELNEEVGVIVTQPPQFIGLFAQFKAFPSDHIALFVVRHWSRPIIPKPNMEIAEQAFFSADALPEGTTRGTRARLHEIFDGSPPSHNW